MASPRRQPPDVRREQLLDAAELVLAERGLRATTVAEVAEAAGVAKGTVYLYYESKDDLLAGVRARYLERFAEAVNVKSSSSASARLRRMVAGLFEFGIEHHELHHLLFHEAGFHEEDAFVGVRSALIDLIAEGVEAGDFHVDEVQLASAFVLNGVHGALVDALHSPPHGSSRRAMTRSANDVADLAVRTLG
jgi:AcrR family transcriptional regulator